MQLLERQSELAVLENALAAASHGRGSVVLVAGEAGIGKSSLVEAFLESVDGARVLAAACDDLLTARPLGPFRDMAIEAGGELAELALEGDHGERIVAGIQALIAGPPRPVVVVIEDVHWADDATLDALRYVGRRVSRLSALLIVTYREEELDLSHPLRGLLGSLTGSGRHRVELRALSPAAVAEMASGGPVGARSLHAITGGNPFYVTEALATSNASVPPTVRDAVLARVQKLSSSTQEALRRLSVVPSRVEMWLVEAMIQDPARALAEAERTGVVAVTQEHLGFRHELARRALEASLPTPERAEHNRRALTALIDHGAEASRIIHHASAARDLDAVLTHGPTAARDAAQLGSHRQAAAHMSLVLDQEDSLDRRTRAGLYSDRAYSRYVLNQFEEAMRDAETAVGLWESEDEPGHLGDALIRLTRAAYWAHGPLAAARAARRAVEVLEPTGDFERLARAYGDLARAHSNLATVGGVAEPAAQSIQHAARALEFADELDSDVLRSHALIYMGSGLLSVGDEAGATELERAIGLVAGRAPVEAIVRACVNAAGSAHRSGRLEDADRYVQEGLRLGSDGEFYAGQYRLELTGASVLVTTGDWDRAEIALESLIARSGEPGIMRPLAKVLLARVRARRGDDRVDPLLADLSDAIAGSDEVCVVGPVSAALVEAAWLRGDVDLMEELAAPALRLAAEQGHRLTLSEVLRYLQRAGLPSEIAPDIGVGPWAPGLAGRWKEAAAAWGRHGDRYERALELASSGEEAATLEGLQILDELGAVAAGAIVRQRLRAMGAAPPRRPSRRRSSHPAGLTTRQVEVLALVAEGLTNKQIADRLYVSVRTVDHHVSAVLTKLGVGTREEAGAMADELLVD